MRYTGDGNWEHFRIGITADMKPNYCLIYHCNGISLQLLYVHTPLL